MRNGRMHKMLIQPEDSHRRKYKLALSIHFLLVTAVNIALDVAFQARHRVTFLLGLVQRRFRSTAMAEKLSIEDSTQ